MIIQELWILNLNWDESVWQFLYDAWTDYLETLNMLLPLQVPRCFLRNANINIQLHAFCDAPIRAYGCCVYVRTKGPSKITVRLWTSKSRVPPVKNQSLPTLELCAAHLLPRYFDLYTSFGNHLSSRVQPGRIFKPTRFRRNFDSSGKTKYLKVL